MQAIEAIDTSVFDEEVADLGARLLNDATMVAALTAVGACIISSIEVRAAHSPATASHQ